MNKGKIVQIIGLM